MNLHRETVALCGAKFGTTVRYEREYIIEMYLDAILQAEVLNRLYSLIPVTALQTFCLGVIKSFGLRPIETDGRCFVSILSALTGRPDDRVDYPFASKFEDAVGMRMTEDNHAFNEQIVHDARAILDAAYKKCDDVYDIIRSASSYNMQHLVDELNAQFPVGGRPFLIKGMTNKSLFDGQKYHHFGFEGALYGFPGHGGVRAGFKEYCTARCRSAGLFLRSGRTWRELLDGTDFSSPVDIDAFLFCFGFLIASGSEFYNVTRHVVGEDEEVCYTGIGVTLTGVQVSLPHGFIIGKKCTSSVHLICLDTCAAIGLIPGDSSFLDMRKELLDDKYVVSEKGNYTLKSLPSQSADFRRYERAYNAGLMKMETAYGNE